MRSEYGAWLRLLCTWIKAPDGLPAFVRREARRLAGTTGMGGWVVCMRRKNGESSIIQYKGAFDSIATYIESDNGKEQVEVWFARDLQKVLGYARWENFLTAINRAVESCKSQNINVDDHFREVTKMIKLAKGAEREIKDYMLTRYAWAARYSS